MPKYTTGIQLEIILPKDLDEKISSINTKIKNNINKIEISLDDNKIKSQIESIKTALSGLNFSNIEKTQKETKKQLDDIYKKVELITKEADGFTTRKLTQEFKKSNEVFERETIIVDKNKKAKIEAEQKSQKEIQKTTEKIKEQEIALDNLGKKIRTVRRFNANKIETGRTDTYKNVQGIETSINVSGGQPTSYKIVNNIEKIEQAELKAQQQIRNAIAQTEQKRRKEIEKSAEVQAKAINKALEEEYKRRQKAQEEMERAFIETEQRRRKEIEKTEQAQAKAINKALEEEYKRRQKLGEQIGVFKNLQKAQITEIDLAKVLSKEYKNQEIRSIELDRVTGKYIATLKENAKQNRVIKGTLDNNTGTLYKHSEALRESTASTKGFVEQLKIALTRVPVWMLAMTTFYQSLHFFTNGIRYINDLNKALTEISIVTGKTQQEVAQLGLEYQKLAYQMGVTTKEIAEASVEFYRQGLSQAEVMERMKIATEYAKISSLDFKQSAEILTATVNSMNVSIERASDVFAYLGDATSTGADEIGVAFQKVGGSAGALNLEFEKVASWIAVISSRTRESATTVGDSIKSILARVQSLKEKGFTEEDGTSVNQVAKALAQAGITLVDAQGQFRNFGIVMDELGKKWDSLDSRTKAYIATTVAGTYQQARFLNLMEGYSDSVKLYEQALQSAGTTQQKYNLWLEGTEAHLNKLVTAGQGVWQHTFDSETIRTFIDFLTKLVIVFDNVIQQFGLLPPVVAVLTTAFMTLNTTLRTTLIANGTELITMFRTLTPAIVGATTTTKVFTVAVNGLNIALGILKATGLTLLKFFTGAILPVAVITALSIGIEKLVEHFSNLRSEAEKTKESLNNSFNSYSSLNDEISQIKNLYNEYENLSSKINLSAEEQKQLISVKQKLAEQFPNIITGYDKEGNAILGNINNIKEEIKQKEKLLEINKKSLEVEFEQSGQTTEKNIKDKVNELNRLTKEYDRLSQYYDKINSMQTLSSGQIVLESGLTIDKEKELKRVVDSMSAIKNRINELQPEVQNLTNDFEKQAQTVLELDDKFKNLGTTVNTQLIDSAQKLNNVNLTDFVDNIKNTNITEYISDIQQAIDNFNNKRINIDEFTKQYTTVFNNIKKLVKETFNLSEAEANEFTQSLMSQISPLGDAQKQILDLNNALQEMKRIQKEAASDLVAYNEIMDEYNNNHSIAQEKLVAFINEHPNLASAIEMVNGKYVLNIQKLQDLIKAQQLAASGAVQGQNIMNSVVSAGTLARIAMYGLEIEKLTTLAQAQAMANTIIAKEFPGGAGDVGVRNKILQQTQADLNRIVELKQLAESMKNVKIPSPSLGGGGSTSKGTSSDASKTKEKEVEIYITDKYAQAMSDLDKQISQSEGRMSQLNKTSKEYRKELELQIFLLQQKQQLSHQEAEDLRKRNIDIEKQIQKLGDFNKLSNEQKEIYNNLKKELDDNKLKINQLSSAWWDYQKNIESIKQSIRDLIVEILESQKTSHLEKLRNEQEKVINNLKKLAELSEKAFDYSYFKKQLQYDIDEIIASLETIDENFLTGVSPITSTSGIRKDLKDIKNDIIDIAREVNDFADRSSRSKGSLENLIRNEIEYADDLKDRIQEINELIREKTIEYQRQEEALENQIKIVTEEYDKQIEAQKEKLRLLDEQIEKEDRLKQLQDINDEIAKTIADKRYSYITAEGKEILTYNKERVNELEKQRDEMIQQFEREDVKKAIQDEIDRLEKAKNDKLDILNKELEKTKEIHRASLDALNIYKDNLNVLYDALKQDIGIKIDELNTLYEQDIQNAENRWNKIVEATQNGTSSLDELLHGEDGWYAKAIEEMINFNNEIEKQVEAIKDTYESLGDIEIPSSPLSSSGGGGGDIDPYTGYPGSQDDWRGIPIDEPIDPSYGRSSSSSNIPGLGWPEGSKNIWDDKLGSGVELPDGTRVFSDKKKKNDNISKTKIGGFDYTFVQAHNGGIIGNQPPSKVVELVNKLFNTQPNEQIVKSLIGEIQVPPQNIIRNFIPNMRNLLSQVSTTPSQVNNITQKHYHFNNLTVRANSISEFLKNLEFHILSSQS